MASPKSLESILWLVQANGKDHQSQTMGLALQELGIPYRGIYVKPFTDELALEEPVPTGVLPIFWGSTSLMKQVAASPWAHSACFFYRPDGFHYPTWQRHLGKKLLNSRAKILPMKEIAETWPSNYAQRHKFLRPLGDLKDFSGTVMSREEFLKWYEDLKTNGGYSITPDTPLVWGRPKRIVREWRFFIVQRKIVSASLYKEHGKLNKVTGASPMATQFVESLLDGWLPMDTVCLDVGEIQSYNRRDQRNMRIIEFNVLNASGFYAHDVKAIVKAVTDHAIEVANRVYDASSHELERRD